MTDKHGFISPRDETFQTKLRTSITKEVPSADNPFVAKEIYWHGVPLIDLLKDQSFSQAIFLLLRGTLPTDEESVLFDRFLVAMANPGPRHPGTRAAMAAASGKSRSPHVLPIGLSVIGGEHGGALEVEAAMRFIRKSLRRDPEKLAATLLDQAAEELVDSERIAPGFGTLYGSVDPLSLQLLEAIHSARLGEGSMTWTLQFAKALTHGSSGILVPGVAAAVLLELGFHPRAGVGLFQLAAAAGLLAHSQELATSHYTALPMVGDENYEYREDDVEHA